MSGAPGAVHEADYYSISIYGGLSENIDPPPDEDPNEYLATYYDEENKPYELWLERCIPELEAVFQRAREERGMPLAPLGEKDGQVYGLVIEDTDAAARNPSSERHGKNWLLNARGRAARVTVDSVELGDFEYAAFTVAVNQQVKRSDLDWLAGEVVNTIRGHATR